jgi:hypothetical protein
MSERTRADVPYVAPAPSPELRRLDPLVGQWAIEGYAQESLAGPAGPVRSRESFEWLEGGYFLVHRYETHFGDQPVQKGIMFWGFDESARRFLLHFFSNNGPFTSEGNIYEGELRNNSLVCTGPARFTIKLDDQGRVSVGHDGTFDIDWELRDANGIWRPWMHDTYRRIG